MNAKYFKPSRVILSIFGLALALLSIYSFYFEKPKSFVFTSDTVAYENIHYAEIGESNKKHFPIAAGTKVNMVSHEGKGGVDFEVRLPDGRVGFMSYGDAIAHGQFEK